MNDHYSKTEALLIKIAREYLNLPIEESQKAIQSSLHEMAVFVGADRAYIFSYDMQKMQCSNTHEWCGEGISAEIDNLQDVDVTAIPEWIAAHENGEALYYADVFALPEEHGVRQILEPQGVKSIITVPMLDSGQLVGFLGFDSVNQYHSYSEKEIKLLWLYAEMLVNLYNREKTIKILEDAKQRAEDANRAKSEFLANMSHEIRTPLSAILGYCDILKTTSLNQKQAEYVETIGYAGNLLSGIVGDILDFSKIEAGKLQLENITFSMRSMCANLEKMFIEKTKRKGITLLFDVSLTEDDVLVADKLRLTQVLVNLINNAIKFTYSGSITVTIQCKQESKRFADFYLSVADTGIGMAPELISRLFLPFEQASSSTNRKYGGSGLGLAISQRIINAMGGELKVESIIGQGSTFYTELKLAKGKNSGENQTAIKHSTLQKMPNLDGINILIAEDVKLNRDLLSHIFAPTKAALAFAEDGEQAVSMALNQNYDLIIMDLQMPLLDGFNASQQIMKAKPEAIIIALSAAASALDVSRSSAAGIQRHLAKPINKQVLFATISELLAK